jgi:hypothetical protein
LIAFIVRAADRIRSEIRTSASAPRGGPGRPGSEERRERGQGGGGQGDESKGRRERARDRVGDDAGLIGREIRGRSQRPELQALLRRNPLGHGRQTGDLEPPVQ